MALSRLPALRSLQINYNRIGVLSSDILRAVKGLEQLSLNYNIIREIPEGTFKDLTRLEILSLYGNQIDEVNEDTFMGIDATIEMLDLGLNIISDIKPINYPNLRNLNLEKNMIRNVTGVFNNVKNLQLLNLGENDIAEIGRETFKGMTNLVVINLNNNKIRRLEPGVFENQYMVTVNMSGNRLEEIDTRSFSSLLDLHEVDLSHNQINSIKNGAFDNIPNLRKLHLQHNNLNTYTGDIYTGMGNDTELEVLDLSHNDINYLYPESFSFHPNLRHVNFARNRLPFFPTQFIKDLVLLETLNLEANKISALEDEYFANMPRLRSLKLARNEITTISETTFQNSSQLQYIDLSHNNISELKDNVFNGILRLELDASHNNLSSLPRHILKKNKVFRLDYIDLSYNQFNSIPEDVLLDQYYSLETFKISHNRIRTLPRTDNALVNVKDLDLSFNPLTDDIINNVLGEAKTFRFLNMAGTGITKVPKLDSPFLISLNISHNNIKTLTEDILKKSQLETLDVSHNQIPALSTGLASAWLVLKDLKHLNISYNPIAYIIRGDFKYLNNLETLSMTHLDKCTKIDRSAFTNMGALRSLDMYGYPKVSYIDVKGILANFKTLEQAYVEVKDPIVGDHLTPAFSPRLRRVGVMGAKVENIAISALHGISSKVIDIDVSDTNIKNLPTAIFFPVPMSSKIKLDVAGSKLTSIGPQLLNTLDSKQRHIRLEGLASNPVYCDCNAQPLWKWLRFKSRDNSLYSDLPEVACAAPEFLAGRLLVDVDKADLSCEGRPTTTTTEVVYATATTPATTAQDIIWQPQPTTTRAPKRPPPIPSAQPNQNKSSQLAKMDSLIIGIVGGVVAFITIIIIIICIIRLRLADNQYRGGPLAGPLALRAQGKCTCLKPMHPHHSHPPPMTPTMYGNHGFISYPSTPVPPPHHAAAGPPLALTWNGTVTSQKMLQAAGAGGAGPASVHGSHFGTVGANSYMSGGARSGVSRPASVYPGAPYPNTPYYVTFPADSDTEMDRRSHR